MARATQAQQSDVVARKAHNGRGLPRYLNGGARRRASVPSMALRFVGAVGLLAMAAVHLERFFGAHYSDIPTIGTLFALNFAGGTLAGLGLLAPLERIGERRSVALVVVLALVGIAIAATSFAFLLVSESTPLFGFRESGYGAAMVVALVSEAVATVSLAAYLAARIRNAPSRAR